MSLTVHYKGASDFVNKHSTRVLKRTITEQVISDEDWKGGDSIRVICRFRPANKREKAYSQENDIPDDPPDWESEQTVRVNRIQDKSKGRSSNKPYKCTLDTIFASNTTQKQIFYSVGQPMILSTLEGFNSTIFAYGQSGSGKTYTMFGPEDDPSNIEHFGLIPRCFIYLFQRLNAALSKNGGKLQEYKVNMELLQIYKRDLLDLLYPQSKTKLVIKTDFRTDTVFVQNLRQVTVNTVEEAFACLTEAQSNRIVAGHALNAVSSRSHMLVCAHVIQRHVDGSVVQSKLNFGDLAGSEDLTKALGKNPDPERRKEAIAINSSLSALTTAMSFLSKGKKPGYRDSPLTHILKDSLGGNSKTIMFVACSPHIFNRNETIRALRFASTAKKVKNKAKKNEQQSVQSMKKRIKELELQVASLEAQLIETKGTKNVLKKVMTRMAVVNDDLGKTKLRVSATEKAPTILVSLSKIDEEVDVDVNELLQENGDEQELNYIHQISELRKKLEESLGSNKELNAEIKSKNMELEQCNNKIDQLLEEAQQAKKETTQVKRKLSKVQGADGPDFELPKSLPQVPLPRSRAQTDWIRGSQLNVLSGHEPMESMDGNTVMLKHLQELIVDSQQTTADMDKDMNIRQLTDRLKIKDEKIQKLEHELQKDTVKHRRKCEEQIVELKEEVTKLKQQLQFEETQNENKDKKLQTVIMEYEEYRSLLEELKIENQKIKQKHMDQGSLLEELKIENQKIKQKHMDQGSLLEELKIENQKIKQKHMDQETLGHTVEIGLMDMRNQGKQELLKKYNGLSKEHEDMKRELRLKKNQIEQLLSDTQHVKNTEVEDTNPQPSTCSDGWKSFCVGIGWH